MVFRSVTHECVGDAPFFFVSMIGGVVRGGGVWVLSVGGVCGVGVYESGWWGGVSVVKQRNPTHLTTGHGGLVGWWV